MNVYKDLEKLCNQDLPPEQTKHAKNNIIYFITYYHCISEMITNITEVHTNELGIFIKYTFATPAGEGEDECMLPNISQEESMLWR